VVSSPADTFGARSGAFPLPPSRRIHSDATRLTTPGAERSAPHPDYAYGQISICWSASGFLPSFVM
jgi:hypothetical protein